MSFFQVLVKFLPDSRQLLLLLLVLLLTLLLLVVVVLLLVLLLPTCGRFCLSGGPSGEPSGPLRALFGRPWSLLGRPCGPPRAPLGSLGASLGALSGALGRHSGPRRLLGRPGKRFWTDFGSILMGFGVDFILFFRTNRCSNLHSNFGDFQAKCSISVKIQLNS